MAEEGDKNKGVVWLNAWRDPVANLKAFSCHIFFLYIEVRVKLSNFLVRLSFDGM